jgi:hypothetical protein
MPSKAEDREAADLVMEVVVSSLEVVEVDKVVGGMVTFTAIMLVEVVRAKGVVEELVLGITHLKSGRV